MTISKVAGGSVQPTLSKAADPILPPADLNFVTVIPTIKYSETICRTENLSFTNARESFIAASARLCYVRLQRIVPQAFGPCRCAGPYGSYCCL